MLDNLLDYIPDGVFTVDAEWRVTFFNHAARADHRDQAGRRSRPTLL